MWLKNVRGVKLPPGRAIVRVDMNVPMERGRITDDSRIARSLATIRFLRGKNIPVFIVSHFGNPAGFSKQFSIHPIAERAAKLLGVRVEIIKDPMKPPGGGEGPILFSENIRFWRGEKENSPEFAKALSRWGGWYVNDAFSESHRPFASIFGLPKYLPAYAGCLMEEEVSAVEKILKVPRRPFLVIMGGAKISTKLPYIESLIKKADTVVVGGALLNTVLAARGYEVGKSIVERGMMNRAAELKSKKMVILPDVRVTKNLRGAALPQNKSISEVNRGEYICDIGDAALGLVVKLAGKAGTILWNGPLGYLEAGACRAGTENVMRAVCRLKRGRAVIGGGDLGVIWRSLNLKNKNIYVSTGGGALLDFAVHGTLPGLEPLKMKG